MNRNRWITGLVIVIAFMILILCGSVLLFMKWNSTEGYIGTREPLARLGYCSSEPVKPCILSFNLNVDGRLVINLLTDGSASPAFYLKIRQAERENLYICQNVNGFPTRVVCVGKTVPVGEVLQFLLVTTNDSTPFAEGRFPIIGVAIATPQIAPTPTPTSPPIPGRE